MGSVPIKRKGCIMLSGRVMRASLASSPCGAGKPHHGIWRIRRLGARSLIGSPLAFKGYQVGEFLIAHVPEWALGAPRRGRPRLFFFYIVLWESSYCTPKKRMWCCSQSVHLVCDKCLWCVEHKQAVLVSSQVKLNLKALISWQKIAFWEEGNMKGLVMLGFTFLLNDNW